MADYCSMCISALNKSEFYQADRKSNRYYFRMINKLLFAVNVNSAENGAEIVYGVCLPENAPDLCGNGIDDSLCTLRRCANINCYDDMKTVYASVADYFYRWKRLDVTRRDVISCVNERNRRFTNEISEILMPFGFKKSGCKWYCYKDERLSIELCMQKSPICDAYYFNIYVVNNDIGMPCYASRLSVGLFDWQLRNMSDLIDSLNEAAEKEILPIINGSIEDLGNSELIKKHCYCKRSVCENCWIKGE